MAKILIGVVVSTKMQKTIVVRVERRFKHRAYKKTIVKHKKYKVHNDDSKIKVGDTVKIQETKPISKDKNFIVVKE